MTLLDAKVYNQLSTVKSTLPVTNSVNDIVVRRLHDTTLQI